MINSIILIFLYTFEKFKSTFMDPLVKLTFTTPIYPPTSISYNYRELCKKNGLVC